MEQSIDCNIINVLYYLYFQKSELVYYYERIWSDDGMRYLDEEYAYIFSGVHTPHFSVDTDTYYFLYENDMLQETSGNQNETIYELRDECRATLSDFLKKERKEFKKI